jgi:hypothetical protein
LNNGLKVLDVGEKSKQTKTIKINQLRTTTLSSSTAVAAAAVAGAAAAAAATTKQDLTAVNFAFMLAQPGWEYTQSSCFFWQAFLPF